MQHLSGPVLFWNGKKWIPANLFLTGVTLLVAPEAESVGYGTLRAPSRAATAKSFSYTAIDPPLTATDSFVVLVQDIDAVHLSSPPPSDTHLDQFPEFRHWAFSIVLSPAATNSRRYQSHALAVCDRSVLAFCAIDAASRTAYTLSIRMLARACGAGSGPTCAANDVVWRLHRVKGFAGHLEWRTSSLTTSSASFAAADRSSVPGHSTVQAAIDMVVGEAFNCSHQKSAPLIGPPPKPNLRMLGFRDDRIVAIGNHAVDSDGDTIPSSDDEANDGVDGSAASSHHKLPRTASATAAFARQSARATPSASLGLRGIVHDGGLRIDGIAIPASAVVGAVSVVPQCVMKSLPRSKRKQLVFLLLLFLDHTDDWSRPQDTNHGRNPREQVIADLDALRSASLSAYDVPNLNQLTEDLVISLSATARAARRRPWQLDSGALVVQTLQRGAGGMSDPSALSDVGNQQRRMRHSLAGSGPPLHHPRPLRRSDAVARGIAVGFPPPPRDVPVEHLRAVMAAGTKCISPTCHTLTGAESDSFVHVPTTIEAAASGALRNDFFSTREHIHHQLPVIIPLVPPTSRDRKRLLREIRNVVDAHRELGPMLAAHQAAARARIHQLAATDRYEAAVHDSAVGIPPAASFESDDIDSVTRDAPAAPGDDSAKPPTSRVPPSATTSRAQVPQPPAMVYMAGPLWTQEGVDPGTSRPTWRRRFVVLCDGRLLVVGSVSDVPLALAATALGPAMPPLCIASDPSAAAGLACVTLKPSQSALTARAVGTRGVGARLTGVSTVGHLPQQSGDDLSQSVDASRLSRMLHRRASRSPVHSRATSIGRGGAQHDGASHPPLPPCVDFTLTLPQRCRWAPAKLYAAAGQNVPLSAALARAIAADTVSYAHSFYSPHLAPPRIASSNMFEVRAILPNAPSDTPSRLYFAAESAGERHAWLTALRACGRPAPDVTLATPRSRRKAEAPAPAPTRGRVPADALRMYAAAASRAHAAAVPPLARTTPRHGVGSPVRSPLASPARHRSYVGDNMSATTASPRSSPPPPGLGLPTAAADGWGGAAAHPHPHVAAGSALASDPVLPTHRSSFGTGSPLHTHAFASLNSLASRHLEPSASPTAPGGALSSGASAGGGASGSQQPSYPTTALRRLAMLRERHANAPLAAADEVRRASFGAVHDDVRVDGIGGVLPPTVVCGSSNRPLVDRGAVGERVTGGLGVNGSSMWGCFTAHTTATGV